MKLAYLASRSSIHTVKWANAMAERGHEVHLISMHREGPALDKRVLVYYLPFGSPIGYFINAPVLKKHLNSIKPQVLHVHYATGYGTLGRLSNFHPTLLSAWGSDILSFPYKSRWNKWLLQKNLKYAELVSSVCYMMKNEIMQIDPGVNRVEVVPFGVDCERFKPAEKDPTRQLCFGTVKSLAPVYGISTLIRAFDAACRQGLEKSQLVIVGGGPQEAELKSLVAELNLDSRVDFIGPVSQEEVPNWLNKFDVFLALSESEGLSVSVLEAAACGLPVIVTDVGAMKEAVVENETGFIVPKNNPGAASEKMLELALNPQKRIAMGKKARHFVLDNYQWSSSAARMEKLYHELS